MDSRPASGRRRTGEGVGEREGAADGRTEAASFQPEAVEGTLGPNGEGSGGSVWPSERCV